MTIGELRALPVGRGQIGEVRYLPVGVAPRGSRGRGHGAGREVPASIARIGVKLPVVGQHQEPRGVESMVREELESLKPDISENPWVRNDVKRNKLLEKMKSFVSKEDEDESFENLEASESDRNSTKREDLKKELDEVLRGIRQMGGVGAICREREGGQAERPTEPEAERERAEKLWRKQEPEKEEEVVEAFDDLVQQNALEVEAAVAGQDEVISEEEEEKQEDEMIRRALEDEPHQDEADEEANEAEKEGGAEQAVQEVQEEEEEEAFISITPL